MCLYTKWKKAKTSIFPKTRYKILIKYENCYSTPFENVLVKPSPNSIFKASSFFPVTDSGTIENGIHTYKSKKSAKSQIKRISWGYSAIFKVKIPRGTLYFDGYDFNDNASSCSEKIQFIKRIL